MSKNCGLAVDAYSHAVAVFSLMSLPLLFSDDVADILKAKYKHVVKPELDIINTTNGGEKIDTESRDDEKCESKEIRKLGRIIRIPGDKQLEDYTVIYIGEESASLTNWMMNLNKCRFCRFDPVSNRAQIETLNVNKILMKRYCMIERAKDASIVGVLAGTLGVKDHLAVMDRMKKLVKAVGKKSYTFVVSCLGSFTLSESGRENNMNKVSECKDHFRASLVVLSPTMFCRIKLIVSHGFIKAQKGLLPRRKAVQSLDHAKI